MKAAYYLNYLIVGIPAFLFALGVFVKDCTGLAMIASIFTGAYQVGLGFCLLLFDFYNKLLWIYALGVALFFFLIAHGIQQAWVIPPILAVYFTYILYTKIKKP